MPDLTTRCASGRSTCRRTSATACWPNTTVWWLFPGVLDDEAVRAAANLSLIQLVSAGYDRINVKLCRELGVPVANNGGTNSLDVAEHALMLMLSALRRFADFDRFVKAGQWRGIDSGTNTFTLDGKTRWHHRFRQHRPTRRGTVAAVWLSRNLQ